MWWLETPVLLKKAPIGPRSLRHSSFLCPHAAIKRRPSSPLPQPGSISMYIHCLQILWLPIGGLFRNTQLWTNQRLRKACLIHILPTMFWRFNLIVRQQRAAQGIKKMWIAFLKFTETWWNLSMIMDSLISNIIGYFKFLAEIPKQFITFHSLLSMYIKVNLLNRMYVVCF